MNRRLSLLLVPLVAAVVLFPRAAPRPAADIPSGTASLTFPGAAETDQQRTGAPPVAVVDLSDPVLPGGAPTPRPSGGIGQPASYCKPKFCETPKPVAVDGIVGEATWWNSFGSGIYTALRPDLGSKGDLAIVCGPLAHTQNGTSSRAATSRDRAREAPLLTLPTVRGSRDVAGGLVPFHCVTAPVITSCACLGPNSDRLIDLSLDLFREFADPSRGVVKIVLQVVRD